MTRIEESELQEVRDSLNKLKKTIKNNVNLEYAYTLIVAMLLDTSGKKE